MKKKTPIDEALNELKKAYESKDIALIDSAMEKMNEAWKAASEEMYKATQEAGDKQGSKSEKGSDDSDDVTDVDFEEVKEDK